MPAPRHARAGLLVLLAVACSEPSQPVDRSFTAFDTVVTVRLPDVRDLDRAERALSEVETWFQRRHKDWFAFGEGELGRINRALSTGGSEQISDEMATLVKRSLELRALSGGRFDPTVGMLVETWGFQTAPAPAVPTWERALPETGVGIHITDGRIRADDPVKLDLSAVAKGAALESSAQLLRQAGYRSALLDAGGDVLVIGSARNRRWRVGIRDPRGDGSLGWLELTDGEAMVTSGDYERYFMSDGKRFHHVLDPRTGMPSIGAASATVIHSDPVLADAAATALLVAGATDMHEVCAAMNIDTAMVVGSDGSIHMTSAMARRLQETP